MDLWPTLAGAGEGHVAAHSAVASRKWPQSAHFNSTTGTERPQGNGGHLRTCRVPLREKVKGRDISRKSGRFLRDTPSRVALFLSLSPPPCFTS